MQNDSSSEDLGLERNIKLSVYLITIALGLVGNLLVIKDVVAKKEKRTANDIFITNLAIADLTLIVILPVEIYTMFNSFPETTFFCSFFLPFNTVPFGVSIFTLTSMAVHRCHVIVHPFSGRLRQKVAIVWVAVLWLVSLVLMMPVMAFSKAQRSSESTMCKEMWPTTSHKKAYTAFLFVIQYLLPLVIIAASYIRICLDLYGVELPRARAPQRARRRDNVENHERDRENARVVRTLAIIVLLFAICMFPIQVAWMMIEFGGRKGIESAAVVFKFAVALAVFHSCLNPIVYGTLTRRVRPLFAKFTARCCPRKRAGSVRTETQMTIASNSGV